MNKLRVSDKEMVSVRPKDSAYAAAMARHISADGCQFVLARDKVAPGQRFRFKLEGHEPVVGTVRWVVADRVGFAFDRPLGRDSQQALTDHCRVMHGLELFLA
ncbi:PilZ domain-containing protein [Novosphingobium sp. CF614]|uniref:PilZ domain-containing protein n=1 Tax=Novosphingobium sp. CF614 TaxID=1884364 RepID=UPI0008E3ED08|nr:PilZ domain-containing protein [Novosphingobium sp. CF614]SFG25341.1 PilZ domain-containing protein [Novosphingobium sp. CF614]